MSRLGLRDVAGRTVVRFLCAAYLAAFAGLRDSHYDVEQVLLPFVQRHGLLTEREWALLSRRGGFAAASRKRCCVLTRTRRGRGEDAATTR
mgnify:CR=1 FL=1